MGYDIDILCKILDDECIDYQSIGGVEECDSRLIITYLENAQKYMSLGEITRFTIPFSLYVMESRVHKLKTLLNENDE